MDGGMSIWDVKVGPALPHRLASPQAAQFSLAATWMPQSSSFFPAGEGHFSGVRAPWHLGLGTLCSTLL